MRHKGTKTQRITKSFVSSAKGRLVPWFPIAIGICGVFLFQLFFSSCNPPELKSPAPAVNTIKVGEKFRIILPENHSEYFFWKLGDNKKKAVDYLNSVWHGNEKGVYYHFEAKKAGQDTINFALYKYNELQRYTSFIVKVD